MNIQCKFKEAKEDFEGYKRLQTSPKSVITILSPAERAYVKFLDLGARDYASEGERQMAILQGLSFEEYLMIDGLKRGAVYD